MFKSADFPPLGATNNSNNNNNNNSDNNNSNNSSNNVNHGAADVAPVSVNTQQQQTSNSRQHSYQQQQQQQQHRSNEVLGPQRPPTIDEDVFLPGACSLIEQLDKKVLVILRDGSKLLGWMRSFDQYANITLEDAFQRHIFGTMYADVRVGLYVIRGENVVLLGEFDEEKDAAQSVLRKVSMDELEAAKKAAGDDTNAPPTTDAFGDDF